MGRRPLTAACLLVASAALSLGGLELSSPAIRGFSCNVSPPEAVEHIESLCYSCDRQIISSAETADAA